MERVHWLEKALENQIRQHVALLERERTLVARQALAYNRKYD